MHNNTGDNLVAARQFASHCADTLRFLLTSGERETQTALQLLSVVRLEAQSMRARSISRMAQTAITEIGAGCPRARCDGTLLVLNKLVRQYRDGLDEIAPAMPQISTRTSKPETADAEALDRARQILLPLRKFAKPGAESQSIKTLLNLVPFTPAQMPEDPSDSFDVIMPAITNESLRKARIEKKSVSVSYASDEIRMDEALAKDVETALITICQNLVNRSVEAPLRRQNQGLSGAAHIAITAREKAKGFNILISCEGPMPSQNLLLEPEVKRLQTYGAALSMTGHDMLTRIDIFGLPLAGSSKTEAVIHAPVHLAASEMRA